MSVIDSWANRLPLLALLRPSGAVAVLSHDVHVRRMFANGEPGAIYDPSDLATLSQYSDGTGVVADVGDPVGRVLDISGCGNHLAQATESQRPRLARVPRSGIRNLLERTEEFDQSFWTKGRSAVAAVNIVAAPDGTQTADHIVDTTAPGTHRMYRLVQSAGVRTYTASIYVRAAESSKGRLAITNQVEVLRGWVGFDLSAQSVDAASASAYSIEDVGGGWCRISVTAETLDTDTAVGFFVYLRNAAGSASYVGDGSSGLYLWGAQLEAGPVATMYQRVGQIYDVYESGAEHSHGLWFDGVDDGLSAAGLDLSGTDRVTVVAAVRMLNLTSGGSASIGMLANFRGTGAASWSLQAPDTSTGRINFSSSGAPESVRSAVVTGLSAPRSAVLTGIGDIAAATVRMRIDGAPAAENLLAQGAGSYESGAMSIGRQADSAVRYYSGCVFGLIIRGAASSAREIAIAEQWAARRAGVVLQ